MANLSTNSAILFRRSCISSASIPFRAYQRRWAQVHDVRFFAVHHRCLDDKILAKYRAKLDQKARAEGLKTVEELKEVYQDKIQKLRAQALVPGANAPLNTAPPPNPVEAGSQIPYQAPPPPVPTPSTPSASSSPPPSTSSKTSSSKGVKTLSYFLNLDVAAQLSAEELEATWRVCHIRDPQSLCATMSAATYARLARTATAHPQFILPIPREGQGAEIHFLQWTFPSETTATVLFTHLAEYKVRGEYAQPHTTVTYHLDLAKKGEKDGMVLLEGRVQENRGVSVDEGKWLLMCLQKFYGFESVGEEAKANAERRAKLMKQFSTGDEGFKVEELLEEAERVP